MQKNKSYESYIHMTVIKRNKIDFSKHSCNLLLNGI